MKIRDTFIIKDGEKEVQAELVDWVKNTNHSVGVIEIISQRMQGYSLYKWLFYDFIEKEIVSEFPMSSKYTDSARLEDGKYIVLGEEYKRIAYDFDEKQYIIMMLCEIEKQDFCNRCKIIDYVGIAEGIRDTFIENYYSIAINKESMRFPFDLYFLRWPKIIGLSENGKYNIFHYEKEDAFILSDVLNGNVYRLFENPMAFSEKNHYLYDEKQDVFQIEDVTGEVFKYKVIQEEKYLEELNRLYNKHYDETPNRGFNPSESSVFQRLFYKSLMKSSQVSIRHEI